jgi:competence protein ComEA
MMLRRLAAAALALVFALGFAAPVLADAKPVPTAKVNINQASVQQLATLPGVGEKLATRILEQRQKQGTFKTVQELLNVKGIGEKNFERLEPFVTVGDPTAPVPRAAFPHSRKEPSMRREAGHSLVELVAVVGLIAAAFAVGLPRLRAHSEESALVGAALSFQQRFREAWTRAVNAGRRTAIRFETVGGVTYYSMYEDGNHNGVLAADIRRGLDARVGGPWRLDSGSAFVTVAVHEGVPAPPPDRGLLGDEPIRFGSSRMISFSPLGSATPGTFYLAGSTGGQAAVRVNANTARVRVMLWSGRAWRQR